MTMKIEALRKFQDEIKFLCEMNGCEGVPTYIFLYPNNKVVVRDGFSLSHMEECTHIIVLGINKWRNGGYVNSIGKLLGMCSYYSGTGSWLSWVREIPIINGWTLQDIHFSNSGGISWDRMKPTLVLRNHKGEEREVTIEKYSGWAKDFPELFKMAYSQED